MSAVILETAARELHWTEDEATATHPPRLHATDNPKRKARTMCHPLRSRSGEPKRSGWSRVGSALDLAPHQWPCRPRMASCCLPLGHDRGGWRRFHDVTALAEYWADGSRSIAVIADLVSLETGRPPSDLPLRYFRLLAQAGCGTPGNASVNQ